MQRVLDCLREWRSRLVDFLVLAGFCLVAAIFIELFREAVLSFQADVNPKPFSESFGIWRFVIICVSFVGFLAAAALLSRFGKPLAKWLFRWRFVLALGLFAILVIFQISGSSVAVWSLYLSGASPDALHDVLFGIPRRIRSDEWLVYTPLALSQENTGYAAVSSIVRGIPTDMTMVYAQPSWALATVFRPFLWGYLFLGSARGLSWFWAGRLIALFMTSFEFGRYLTKDQRVLSLAYALLVSFSPIVGWWFAICGAAELFIYGQLFVLLLHEIAKSKSGFLRIAMSASFAYLAGCYALILYPSWQISVAYVLVMLCVAELVLQRRSNRGSAVGHKLRERILKWAPLAISFVVLAIVMFAILFQSFDTIQAVMGSAYPGHRSFTGGGELSDLFNYIVSWLTCTLSPLVLPNECVSSTFFTLFPLGLIMSAVVFWKRHDPVLGCVLVADVFLLAYGCIGFPEWLAKATLLSNVQTPRLAMAQGFADTVLLVRSAAIIASSSNSMRMSQRMQKAMAALIALLFAILAVYAYFSSHHEVAFKAIIAVDVLFIVLAVYSFLQLAIQGKRWWYVLCVAAIVMISGLCINPIQHGVSNVTQAEVTQTVREVVEADDDGLWIADSNILSQVCIVAGAKTLNSVSTYPALETWKKVDPEGEYGEAYNRYAHIWVEPCNTKTSFEIKSTDSFEVNLNVRDLKKLGISYWLTRKRLEDFNNDEVLFEKQFDAGNSIYVYRVVYR